MTTYVAAKPAKPARPAKQKQTAHKAKTTTAKHTAKPRSGKASKKHTAPDAHQKHVLHEEHLAHLRGWAIGDLLPVCAAEAVAQSLRLAGQRVSPDEVEWLWLNAGGDPAGASLGSTLAAAGRFGLGGYRPVASHDLSGLLEVDAVHAVQHDERIAAGGAEVGFHVPEHADSGNDALRPHDSAVADSLLAAAVLHDSCRAEAEQALILVHQEGDRVGVAERMQCGRVQRDLRAPFDGDHGFPVVPVGVAALVDLEVRHFPMLSLKTFLSANNAALILGVSVPGPHCVLATPDGWWSWGKLWDPWPCTVEEAWAVSWS